MTSLYLRSSPAAKRSEPADTSIERLLKQSLMYYLLELLLIAYSAWMARSFWKAGPISTFLGFLIFLTATLLSSLAFEAAHYLLPLIFTSRLTLFLLQIAIAVAAFIGIRIYLKRRVERDDQKVVKQLSARLHLPLLAERFLTTFMIVVYVMLVLIITLLLVNLAGESKARNGIEHHSLMLHSLLSPLPAQKTTTPKARSTLPEKESMESVMARQGAFLNQLGSGFSAGRDYLAEKTGARAAAEQLAALKLIIGLPAAEKEWLIDTNPSLRGLVEHPSIVAVMKDEKLLDLIEECGKGSPSAIYELTTNQTMNNLLEDKSIILVAKKMDLLKLQSSIEKRRAEYGHPLMLYWHTVPMKRLDQLRSVMRDADWQAASGGMRRLRWEGKDLCGAARTSLVVKRPTRFTIFLKGKAQVVFFANAKEYLLSDSGGGRMVTFDCAPGHLNMYYGIEFQDEKRECVMDVLHLATQ